MKISRKLKSIFKKIAEWEKETPYNFCDRWCERCVHEKQIRCSLYKDELERKITCIAHGRDEDDSEITKAVLEAQYQEIDENLSERIDEFGIGLDNPDIDEDGAVDFEDLPPDIQKHIRFVENNPLEATAKSYSDKAHAFLKETFYGDKKTAHELTHDFETISWYHTLLPVKLRRALCGFHEPAAEGDISLCDAVAQFNVCLKSIEESIKSSKKISKQLPAHKSQIRVLIVLLNNLGDRIKIMMERI